MGRKALGPRLWLDPSRGVWVIRDGTRFVRTGCSELDVEGANSALKDYQAEKYAPRAGKANSDIPVADVLLCYLRERVPLMVARRSKETAAWNIGFLKDFWAKKTLADIRGRTCREYASTRPQQAARRELETLSAAIRFWHKEYGPLPSIPRVTLPLKSVPRQRWLTRQEAARLLRASRGTPHLKRFLLIGLYTGTRAGAIFGLQWMPNTTGGWVDLDARILYRRGTEERETSKKRTPVRIADKLLPFLRRWREQDGGVGHIVMFKGEPVVSLRSSWKAALARAGLDRDVTPHVLRHSRATHLVQAGVDLSEVAGSLGMTVKMLESVYWHQSPHYQKNAAKV